MIALLPCPHCGSEPWFEGDAGQWQDYNRYVEMSVKCCATLTESIGWHKARDMTKAQREAELKTRLTAAWNKREVPEDAPKDAPAQAAPQEPVAPAGWQLVPIEPTPEMLRTYLRANDAYWKRADKLPNPPGQWIAGTPSEATADGYRAMLAAAPKGKA